jgi:hypothetical protein
VPRTTRRTTRTQSIVAATPAAKQASSIVAQVPFSSIPSCVSVSGAQVPCSFLPYALPHFHLASTACRPLLLATLPSSLRRLPPAAACHTSI